MSNLRIGFDAKRLFHNFTGLGNYSRTLVRNLAETYPDHEWHLFTPSVKDHDRTRSFLHNPNYHIHTPGKRNGALWRSWGMAKDLKAAKLDIYHGLSHELPFSLSGEPLKTVVTIHDLIFRHYPYQYGWFDRKIYDVKFSQSCKSADAVVAISESTKWDIVEAYRIDPAKIHVIYQSCASIFHESRSAETNSKVREKYRLPSEFILNVGSVIERKNLLLVVKALSLLPENKRIPVVVVGTGKKYMEWVRKAIVQLGLDSWFIFLPEIYFPDLPAIYQQASIFVYPSLYEGFGIPVIEALFSGVPVITSPNSSLVEAGGPESWYVDPHDAEALADAFIVILENSSLANQMRKKGLLYAENFRQEPLTRQMMKLYQSLVE